MLLDLLAINSCNTMRSLSSSFKSFNRVTFASASLRSSSAFCRSTTWIFRLLSRASGRPIGRDRTRSLSTTPAFLFLESTHIIAQGITFRTHQCFLKQCMPTRETWTFDPLNFLMVTVRDPASCANPPTFDNVVEGLLRWRWWRSPLVMMG